MITGIIIVAGIIAGATWWFLVSTERHRMVMEDKKTTVSNHDAEKTFSQSPEGLPQVVPTQMVQLHDGDTFEMVAEMVQQEVGNRVIKRLAYNRMIPGPIIQVDKNATIKMTLTNKLDVNTTLHSHGVRLADDTFDGLPDTMGGKQPEMKPGERFTYTLNFPDAGVFWYHPHVREDYTQEMGLYGNYHVTEEGYWNPVDREAFLVLDDFSEDDPFYKDFTNKTMMGRFGNIFLINNQEHFHMDAKTGEKIRFYVTNTANTRTFDFSIAGATLTIVGGDIGRGEREFFADHFVIAPAERVIFETVFSHEGTYRIQHRGKKIGEITVRGKDVNTTTKPILRNNASDYAVIRKDMQKLLAQQPDKNLRIVIGMKGMRGRGGMMGRGGRGMMKGDDVRVGEGIVWEETMGRMNAMSTNDMMEWMLIDETDAQNPKINTEIKWALPKNQLIKIEIYNDPSSMHPMQHPIHFHGQRFVVLTRDGVPNGNLQWKDTVLVREGERIEIVLETTNPGTWMTHCHIAEHLHAGMAFNFSVY